MHSSDSEMSSLISKAIGRAHVALPGIPFAWLQYSCCVGVGRSALMGLLVSFVLRINLPWMTWGLVKFNCRYLLNGKLKKKKKSFIFITC